MQHTINQRLAVLRSPRLVVSSQLLTNGCLWVAGEEGSGDNRSELYDLLKNVGLLIPAPAFVISINAARPAGFFRLQTPSSRA